MQVPLDSELLRTFLAVAETGSFTRAADAVGRTQSAVSMQMKRLEDALGDVLFVRGARGVELSGRGQQLLPYARRIVSLIEETGAALRSSPLEGPVRIGIPEEYGPAMLPRMLASFAERHPAVEVTVRSETSERHMAALEGDLLDLAVVYTSDRYSVGEVLRIDPTVWVTSVAHRLEERDPVPVAVFGESWCGKRAIDALKQHDIRHRVAYTSDTLFGLISVASAGLAVASLSRSAIPQGCRELTAADGFPPIDSSRVVLRRNPRRSSAAMDGMAQMIRETFGSVAGPAVQAGNGMELAERSAEL
ncbi:LysR family transcriptional regulator [Aliihoeflea aestuarii]|jgi:DNA-binding transcriptional LysR family regulator|uniref:LysR family transcriptional regulator n=1 Tax=Aliihoeflea aestuarii TaxID=453840 RepID=UPI0020964227|nr:LysR substrate-binding domain-containing protein [Aliihoeflea aestuarii]MCO6392818.1 LysR family transcriptional regulator [Aliihoeflea aestuarii]